MDKRRRAPAAPVKVHSSSAVGAAEDDPAENRSEMARNVPATAELVWNGREIDWRYWIGQMPNLSASEAARLLAGLDPVVFADLEARPNGHDPRRACERAANIERVALAEGLPRRTPMEWLTWANGKGLTVHRGFVFAAQEAATAAPVEAPSSDSHAVRKTAEGRYTLEEAAMAIQDGEGERQELLLHKLIAAVHAKVLHTHEPGRRARLEYGAGPGTTSRVREFHEEAYWDDLNKWLQDNEPRIEFRFPMPVARGPRSDPASEAPAPHLTPTLSSDEVCTAFDGVGMSSLDWQKAIRKNGQKWLKQCRVTIGKAGARPVQATWCPLKIAAALVTGRSDKAGCVPVASLTSAFNTRPLLRPLAPHWKALRDDNQAWGE